MFSVYKGDETSLAFRDEFSVSDETVVTLLFSMKENPSNIPLRSRLETNHISKLSYSRVGEEN